MSYIVEVTEGSYIAGGSAWKGLSLTDDREQAMGFGSQGEARAFADVEVSPEAKILARY
jgi:hypothetical protein